MDLKVNTTANENLSFKGLFEIQKNATNIQKNLKIDVSKFTDLKQFRKFFRDVLVSNRETILKADEKTIISEFSDIINNPTIVKDWIKKH